MATKAELVAYAEANGVAINPYGTKAEIEAALLAAGHDPTTIGVPTMTETEPTAEAPLSRNAEFSTYREATGDELDNQDGRPEPGSHVVQEQGEPTET